MGTACILHMKASLLVIRSTSQPENLCNVICDSGGAEKIYKYILAWASKLKIWNIKPALQKMHQGLMKLCYWLYYGKCRN